jgi:hypothetical protein
VRSGAALWGPARIEFDELLAGAFAPFGGQEDSALIDEVASGVA